MTKFNLKNINEEDIFIGDIYIIERTFKKLIAAVKEANPECEYLSPICYSIIAKEGAILIKVDEDNYVDLDGIRNTSDIENINELLNSNSLNNNIILSVGTKDPYVGELIIKNIKRIKKLDKLLEKKLNTLK